MKVLGGNVDFNVEVVKQMTYEEFVNAFRGVCKTPYKETYEALTGRKVNVKKKSATKKPRTGKKSNGLKGSDSDK